VINLNGQSAPHESSTPAPGLLLVEQEARALLVRLHQVKPFAFQQTMVPAAALPPLLLSAIDRYLIEGRSKIKRMVLRFLEWLASPAGHAASPEMAQRRFTMLRMRFNIALAQLDIFADALAQRSELGTGTLLAGLDVVASDALSLDGNYYKLPGLICYLYRGQGAAIRRARTRLPGGGENPVGIVQIPRERMIGSGIASSLIHEVGHQAAALMELVESLRPLLRSLARSSGEEATAWKYWDRCISEIVADFWSVARLGLTSTLGLMGVVSLPRYFVFRLRLDDPHPFPWIRVRLSCAMGRALFPHPQWDRLERIWLSYYPPTGLDAEMKRVVGLMEKTMPALATLIADHRPKALNGASLKEVLETDKRQPAHLESLFKAWRAVPDKMAQAAPSLVFAVIGQARAWRFITPEAEGKIFTRMLNYWALRDTLNPAINCAKPALLRSTAPPLFSVATN
jgi:hypothetical protein